MGTPDQVLKDAGTLYGIRFLFQENEKARENMSILRVCYFHPGFCRREQFETLSLLYYHLLLDILSWLAHVTQSNFQYQVALARAVVTRGIMEIIRIHFSARAISLRLSTEPCHRPIGAARLPAALAFPLA